ncbi:MAG: extracellular solute-binding protein [Phycisphaerae bacterium]|nr:extracellular solute-binding protein [Phycisphaerae bacterium]
MSRWRVAIGAVVAGLLLYWLHPKAVRENPEGAVEVTIWFSGVTYGRHNEVVDAFERRFPEYRAVLGSSAVRTGLEGEGNPQRLMCGVAGGVPPDVVEYDRFAICQWAARGAFKDLTPLIDKDLKGLGEAKARLAALRSEAERLGADDARRAVADQEAVIAKIEEYIIRPEDYYAQTWEECQYRNPDSGKIGQYGIPNYMDDRVMYYNTDMLTQVGLVDKNGEPKPPDTWEQILTKRVDVTDAVIDGLHIHSGSADFINAGVRSGDTLSHVHENGRVTRCIVETVAGPHDVKVRAPYANKAFALPNRSDQHVKVFDQDSYALRLSRWDDEGRMHVVGFEPYHGNAWLYLYGWANGAKFLSEDGLSCLLNDQPVVEALQWTTDVYDALGGYDEVTAFRKSFQNYAQDPFIMNQIAIFIHGDWFMRDLVRYKPDMRFATHPAPVPRHRLEHGYRYCTWVAGFAYCIPSTCPEERLEAAWALVKFLSSVEGGMIMNEHDAQRERAQGRHYISRMKANRKLNELQLRRYINVPEMPERIQQAMQTHIDMLEHSYFRPVSPAGQVLWNAQADAQDIAWSHTMTTRAALDLQTQRVQRSLDGFYNKPAGRTIVNWSLLVWAYAGLLVATAAVVYWRFKVKNRTRGFYRHEWYAGLLFVLPWLVGFIVLSGGPMVFSAIMSMTQYDVINPATYVGLDNYREMFGVDWGGPDAEGKETVPTGVRRSLLNTLFMAIGLPIGMAIGLGMAMLLDTRVSGLKVYRTLFFIPAIMPVVAASILWVWVFNAQDGLLNWVLRLVGIEQLIAWMNVHFDWVNLNTPISWLTNKDTSKPALIIMTLWGAGASMIIWLAGLKDIPTHLYEAAALDGAGPVRRFFKVTLPMLSPYILFNLIIGLIQTFQIFTQAYIMTPNGYPERSTYFYVYKLFDECFSFFRLGYGAAMAWVLFVILVVLTLINMRLSKKWVFYTGE